MNVQPNSFGSGLGIDWSVPPIQATPDNIYPKVVMEFNGQTVTVRKMSTMWRRRVDAGWKERTGPGGGFKASEDVVRS